jgi:hypothetical protein
VAARPGCIVLGFAGLFVVMVGCALLMPAAAVALLRPLHGAAGRAFGLLGRLATRGIVAALSRTSVAMAALTIAVAAAIGVGVMIASFHVQRRDTGRRRWQHPAPGGGGCAGRDVGALDQPAQWRAVSGAVAVERAEGGVRLEIEPCVADQELRVETRYWEGAVRVVETNAGRTAGQGYVELVGYGE